MNKNKLPEYLLETDVLAGFLIGSYPKESFVELLSKGVCYTSVLNAAELMHRATSEVERTCVKQLLSTIKVLGIPSRYALEIGKAGTVLEMREEIMVVMARMNALTIITQQTLRYEGTDTAIQKFN